MLFHWRHWRRLWNIAENSPIKNDEIVQVNIAKSKVVGSYHMMTGQNPIYVVSFELD